VAALERDDPDAVKRVADDWLHQLESDTSNNGNDSGESQTPGPRRRVN
jgi:hypothetical protein